MPAKAYHINPKTGEPGLCHAQVGCPFDTFENHYPTAEDARKAYESVMSDASGTFSKVKKQPRNVIAEAAIVAASLPGGHPKSFEEAKDERDWKQFRKES